MRYCDIVLHLPCLGIVAVQGGELECWEQLSLADLGMGDAEVEVEEVDTCGTTVSSGSPWGGSVYS